MSTGNISIDLLLSDLKSYQDIQDRTQIPVDDFIPKIKKAFPSISDIDALKLINLLLDIQCQSEKVELTITSPVSSKVHIKQNQVVIQEMLSSAQKSIIMTGYSMSDYFSDYVDLLIAKCQRGILVQVFFNHAEKQEQIEKLLRYQGKYLRLYDYQNANDKMSALHAKVISVDGEKTLISSANLSYHGLEGNIEIGTYIESTRIAKQLTDTFKEMVMRKTFVSFSV